jgi:pantothenate kinase
MDRLISFAVTEADMESILFYTAGTVEQVLYPLAGKLERNYRESSARPFLAALAGPPGSGKSAIAAVLRTLLQERGLPAIVLPMDGFHRKNEELSSMRIRLRGEEVTLLSIKGAKETYDVESLIKSILQLREGSLTHWPLYSRTLHEPVERGIPLCNAEALYIIEGNYLLLDKEPWKEMLPLFDKKILITSRERILRRRIIRRKIRGGYRRREAALHFRRSDCRNIREVSDGSGHFDYLLAQEGKYRYRLPMECKTSTPKKL